MVSDLTDRTHGNATGLRPVDAITRRLYNKIDQNTTPINYLVGAQLEIARPPLILESDREALSACMMTVGLTPYSEQKIMRIKNTLDLEAVDISTAYASELEDRSDLRIIKPARELALGDDGYFIKFAND